MVLNLNQGDLLRIKLDKQKADSYNLKNYPKAQKASLNYDSEFILPKEEINKAEKYSTNDWEDIIDRDKKFNTPHWLSGYKYK